MPNTCWTWFPVFCFRNNRKGELVNAVSFSVFFRTALPISSTDYLLIIRTRIYQKVQKFCNGGTNGRKAEDRLVRFIRYHGIQSHGNYRNGGRQRYISDWAIHKRVFVFLKTYLDTHMKQNLYLFVKVKYANLNLS